MDDNKSLDTGNNDLLMNLPIVDISALISVNNWNNPDLSFQKEKEKIITQVCDGFSNIGFILLKGHNLNQSLLSETFNISLKLFNLSQSISSTIIQSPVPRGYAPLNTENFASLIGDIKPNDLNCKFRIGPEYHNNKQIIIHKNGKKIKTDSSIKSNINCKLDDYYGTKAARCLLFPNIWPNDINNTNNINLIFNKFRISLLEMYNEFYKISQLLFNIFESIFIEKNDNNNNIGFNHKLFNKHTSILSTNYYPSINELTTKYKYNRNNLNNRLAIEEHTDVDIFTIIAQNNNEGGVQIKLNNKWLSIPHNNNNNYLIVNIGDGMEYWTNNKWKSTKHKVLIPPNNISRQVVAFFAALNYDAIMKPLLFRDKFNKNDINNKNLVDNQTVTYFKWRKKRIQNVVKQLKKRKQLQLASCATTK